MNIDVDVETAKSSVGSGPCEDVDDPAPLLLKVVFGKSKIIFDVDAEKLVGPV